MMRGYDKDEAVVFILKRLHPQDYPALKGMLETLIPQIIDADMAYMHEAGVLDEEGNAGDSYYEDDDAFEYMVETIAKNNKLTGEQAVKVASLVDDYMDYQQEYCESKGLVEWE